MGRESCDQTFPATPHKSRKEGNFNLKAVRDCYTRLMQSGIWERLSLPFSRDALEWRVLEVKEGHSGHELGQARLRPQLRFEKVVARLDEAVTPSGWSNRYAALGTDALSCELTVQGVTKSSVAALNGRVPADIHARDAFVYTAELFGLKPPADSATVYWVDYDPEAGTPLFEPDLSNPPTPETAPEATTPPASEPQAQKPAGQQAIDRLVERLRGEGRGLEVAKLVTRYGGYGDDTEAARELYSKLRALLLENSALPS